MHFCYKKQKIVGLESDLRATIFQLFLNEHGITNNNCTIIATSTS